MPSNIIANVKVVSSPRSPACQRPHRCPQQLHGLSISSMTDGLFPAREIASRSIRPRKPVTMNPVLSCARTAVFPAFHRRHHLLLNGGSVAIVRTTRPLHHGMEGIEEVHPYEPLRPRVKPYDFRVVTKTCLLAKIVDVGQTASILHNSRLGRKLLDDRLQRSRRNSQSSNGSRAFNRPRISPFTAIGDRSPSPPAIRFSPIPLIPFSTTPRSLRAPRLESRAAATCASLNPQATPTTPTLRIAIFSSSEPRSEPFRGPRKFTRIHLGSGG